MVHELLKVFMFKYLRSAKDMQYLKSQLNFYLSSL